MSLKQLLSHMSVPRLLSLIPLVWISLQLKGYYWVLTVILLFLVYKFIGSIRPIVLTDRPAFLVASLLIFSASMFISAGAESGLQGLVSEVPITLPILPIFLLSFLSSAPSQNQSAHQAQLRISLFAIALSVAVDALVRGLILTDSPASSLRPLEIQAASGIFLLTAITISTYYRSCIIPHKYSLFLLSSVVFLLSFSVFACFRGATSAAAFLINIFVMSFMHLFPVMKGRAALLVPLVFALLGLALSLLIDLRFLFLKYILTPFVSEDPGNGRLDLLYSWVHNYEGAFTFLGTQRTIPADFFLHNIILDSIIKDGLFPASSMFLFFALSFLLLVQDCFRMFNRYRLLNLLLFVFMAFPAFLQPVQYAHAFAFILSVATVGILTSMGVGGRCPTAGEQVFFDS